jgi:hypothetical protein
MAAMCRMIPRGEELCFTLKPGNSVQDRGHYS